MIGWAVCVCVKSNYMFCVVFRRGCWKGNLCVQAELSFSQRKMCSELSRLKGEEGEQEEPESSSLLLSPLQVCFWFLILWSACKVRFGFEAITLQVWFLFLVFMVALVVRSDYVCHFKFLCRIVRVAINKIQLNRLEEKRTLLCSELVT